MRWLLLAFLLAADSPAQSPKPKLQYVVVLSRHGVRAPTAAIEDLHRYSSEPWPDFGVEPGELTVAGHRLMSVLGAWYRAWLGTDAFLPQGCEGARLIHVRADVDHRTAESGTAFAEGFAPGCNVPVTKADDEPDPLFHPAAAGLVKGDGKTAQAAVLGRIGANAKAFTDVYAPAFATLDRILGKPGLLLVPTSVAATEEGLADIRGPIRTGSTLTENLLLEYANGMSGKNLGWGRLDAKSLQEIMAIHTAYADLARRTPYLARLQGSNLLRHILLSLDQAQSGHFVKGALGKPSDRVLYLGAHDTNITHVASLLDLSWLIPGYQRDDSPPGGALVFRLWKTDSKYSIDALFVSQTLQQMHDSVKLTAEMPPAIAPIFIPGCSGPAYSCDWTVFRTKVASAIDQSAVSAEAR